MQKIVINKRYGGFGLSHEATKRVLKAKGKECHFFMLDIESDEYIPFKEGEEEFMYHPYTTSPPTDDSLFFARDLDRDDPDLVKVVEELGEKANDDYSLLVVVNIPDGVEWIIEEYDGREWISEKHRTWS